MTFSFIFGLAQFLVFISFVLVILWVIRRGSYTGAGKTNQREKIISAAKQFGWEGRPENQTITDTEVGARLTKIPGLKPGLFGSGPRMFGHKTQSGQFWYLVETEGWSIIRYNGVSPYDFWVNAVVFLKPEQQGDAQLMQKLQTEITQWKARYAKYSTQVSKEYLVITAHYESYGRSTVEDPSVFLQAMDELMGGIAGLE